MKRSQRVTLFLFGPGIVGSVLMVVRVTVFPPHDLGQALSMLPAFAIGGVVLSIVPAAIYALLMELWLWQVQRQFRQTWSRAAIRSLTILLSTLLGTAAGVAITWVNKNAFVEIGGMTGLILGLYLVTEIFPSSPPKRVQP